MKPTLTLPHTTLIAAAISFSMLLAAPTLFAKTTIALTEVLDKNGKINNPRHLSGTLDFSGFYPVMDDCEGLLFLPAPPVVPGWNALGAGLSNDVYAIAISGSDVYVGGFFAFAGDHIARWNGSAWNALGSGLNGGVLAIAISGSDVYVGGAFTNAGGNGNADRIARWNGSAWNALGSGLNSTVYAIAISGSDVYVGGAFTNAGGNGSADQIARWDGSTWNALGSGLNDFVTTIAISGSDVYVGGAFTDAGGNGSADRIARWNGSAWNALGSGLNSGVEAIAISGSDVYVGGGFTDAGGNGSADWIARWDGSAWNALGSGLNSGVEAIAISGSDVYVGGAFTDAGGNADADRIARWDGSTWNALGSGLNSDVEVIAISGSDVYVGGAFTNAGGNGNADYIARWEEAPLPVEIAAFTATDQNKSCLLTWLTSSEIQNAHFLVQHLSADKAGSTDGRCFQDLVKIPGNGDSQEENHYEYLHENPSHGTNYYRLKQVDFDGSFEYSQVVSVEMTGGSPRLTIFPNPSDGNFSFRLQGAETQPLTALLTDLWGRTVWGLSMEEGAEDIPCKTNLPKGIYFLCVESGNEVWRQQVVVH